MSKTIGRNGTLAYLVNGPAKGRIERVGEPPPDLIVATIRGGNAKTWPTYRRMDWEIQGMTVYELNERIER